MATVLDPAEDLFDFADQLGLFSSRLLVYRIKNKSKLSESEREELLNLELQLDKATADVRAQGIEALGVFSADVQAEIVAATGQADEFLKKIRKVEKVVGVLTAFASLALAVIGRKPNEIIAAVNGVRTAIG
ncbi:hypothetical protein FHT32_001456 [Variovorax sp. SG517]|uniref:hypothetical protein n=1 Tax=Variovorax sp. SG517 TaxID=2587117 RepID=UPI00159E48EC|nr:hypothetical protein [Variovorax sp. SG517]NVM87817.1 hypothetical protein [Variovorax sp. SG517]